MIYNFLFHRVNPCRDRLWDPMDVALFDRCISYIKNNFQIELFENLTAHQSIPTREKIATIMFDDGYKDNIEFAADILKKHFCKASFYVVTDSIEKNTPTWTHIIEHLFQKTKISNADFDFEILPENLKVKTLENNRLRIEYVKKLKPFLKTISHKNRNLIVNHIIEKYSDVALPKLMMNWADLYQLKQDGHYIGSHSFSHAMLGTIENESEIETELNESANMISKNLGHVPKTISYPVGSYNETVINLAKKTGYTMGLAVKQRIYNPLLDSLFEIPRIELYNEPWFKTKLRITNRLEQIKSILKYK